MVYVQIPELWTWGDRWIVYTREVERNGDAQVSSHRYDSQSDSKRIKNRYAGWWGQTVDTRFQMGPKCSPIPGAQGFQQSNPAVLTVASLLGSLETFKKGGMMKPLRERSKLLTGKLENLLRGSKFFVPPEEASKRNDPGFTIITPPDPESRGAQLSLLFLPQGRGVMDKVFVGLKEWGVIGDDRKPDVIRLAPTPLYNTVEDVEAAAKHLDHVLLACDPESSV